VAELDDVTVRLEHRVDRNRRIDGAAQRESEVRESLVTDVTAAPRQSRILRDDTRRIEQPEHTGEVALRHRRIESSHDLDVRHVCAIVGCCSHPDVVVGDALLVVVNESVGGGRIDDEAIRRSTFADGRVTFRVCPQAPDRQEFRLRRSHPSMAEH
jgi:hypothetical protein